VPKAKTPTPRSQKLLERVYLALGANKIHERWIDDKNGVLGLAEPGVITISPHAFVPVILHEALHRAYPEWSERSIEAAVTHVYFRMNDDDCKRIWHAYAAKVVRMRKPTTAE
jgi:hypothetical protein